MATISSAGAIEGVDLTKVMSNASSTRLKAGTQRPPQVENVAEISSDGMRQSAITALAEAASQLASKALWSSTVASSSAPTAVTARSNAQTPAGTSQVEVTQLASAQVTSTATFSSLSTVVGLGTLNIEMGSWDVPPTTFATNPNWPKANVVLGPKNDTLDRVRDKINAAGLGVVATVVSDATGSRLVLRSTGTGVDNGFRITTEEAAPAESGSDVAALSALGFDPSSAGKGGMQLLQSASNAQVRINNESVESPLNLIESQDGLSLILKKPTDAPVTINVMSDQAGIQRATQNFAQAYNALQNLGGSVASTVHRGAESLLGTSGRPTELGHTLAQTGMTRTPEGELKIDTQQLTTALQQNSATVRKSQTMLAQQVLADLPANSNVASPEAGARVQPNAELAASTPSSTAGTLRRQRLLDQYQGIPSPARMEDNEPSFLPVASRA